MTETQVEEAQAEQELQAAETAQPAAETAEATPTDPAAPVAEAPKAPTRHKVPEGIATPIEALHAMKQRNLVPQDFPPQRMYGFVKNPGKTDPFPVKHYDAAGVAHDDVVINEHGVTLTRPGVVLDEVIAWWNGKGARDEAKAKAKAAAALAKAEKAKAKPAAGAPAAQIEQAPEGAGTEDQNTELVEAE